MFLNRLFLAALCAPALLVSAQQPTLQQGPKPVAPAATIATMPADKLLALARSRNGLGEVVGEPWHVKATFDILTAPLTGKFSSGTYEETWYSPQNYTRSIEYKGVKHTDTATPDGLYRLGDQAWSGAEEFMVRQALVHPIQEDAFLILPEYTLQVRSLEIGKTSAPCVYFVAPVKEEGLTKKEAELRIEATSLRLCFDPSAPILRYRTSGVGSDEMTYNRIAAVHGRYVAQDIQLLVTVPGVPGGQATVNRQPAAHVHVLEVGVAPPATSALTPPEGSKLITAPVTIPWDAEVLDRLPAESNRVRPPLGTRTDVGIDPVMVAVVIGPDGLVKSANVLSGTQSCRQVAVDSLLKSKFKPFLLAGKPVEVHTTAKIEFRVGGRH